MQTLTARQEAKLNMYEVVAVTLDANSAITAANAALTAAIVEFKAFIAQIMAAAQTSSAVLTGIAADKKATKNSVSQTAAVIAGQIFAFAAKNGNNTLKQAVNFSATDLRRVKDGEFVPRCQTIHNLGVEHKTALADYGITDAKLADLQTAIDDYAQSVPKPRAAITDRATVKANIKQYFRQADTLLAEQVDKLVETFSKESPDFVATYRNARVIIDPKSKKKESDGTDNGGGNNPPA